MSRVEPTYFPPSTFSNDMHVDDFMQQWFGKHLRSMDEPRLCSERDADTLRLLTLPTFHEPRLVRIERHVDAIQIVAKQTNGRGGYGPGRLTTDKMIESTVGTFDEAISALKSMNFWDLPSMDDAAVKDGTKFVIEATVCSVYNVLVRSSLNKRESELLNWINSHAKSMFINRG